MNSGIPTGNSLEDEFPQEPWLGLWADTEEYMTKQRPPDVFHSAHQTEPLEDGTYPTSPPSSEIITVSLAKTAYPTRKQAAERAKQLFKLRNLRAVDRTETARYWVWRTVRAP